MFLQEDDDGEAKSLGVPPQAKRRAIGGVGLDTVDISSRVRDSVIHIRTPWNTPVFKWNPDHWKEFNAYYA